MENCEMEGKIAEITRLDSRYPTDAYAFVRRSVEFAVTKSAEGKSRQHISAQKLLEQIVVFAEKEYGPFAESVLRGWGVNSASDIGNIVFNMIKVKALSASEKDSPEDFNIKYDLFGGLRHEVKPRNTPETGVPVIA